ncbi:NUDIX domain-containing protein [Actinomadura sp. KC06]|uniref:NUDIX domain-containing protein n=1 Tax=Actinomadura sp. KC06 TaxID=2530369 RepID=UPI001A9F61F3|nr:NUDIX domain-containing protein [Actinomadura sp. KC06]
MIKEVTATVFVFRRSQAVGWRLGLVWHPRFQGWITPGGHVEANETAAEAAERETSEELGCRVRLVPGPSKPLPVGFPHTAATVPWWIVEMGASPDNHTRDEHVHVDHVFVAEWVADVCEPETRVRWVTEHEVADLPDLAEDTRLQAKELFASVDAIVAV